MIQFGIAVAVFVLTHLIPAVPAIRQGLIARLGQKGYTILFSLVSLASLTWVIVAVLNAPVVLLWDSAGWQAWATLILTPLGLFLAAAGLMSPNPLSLSLFPGAERNKGAIVLVTRHPVFWGVLLWALSHIPPNGDVRSLALFSLLAALAASGFWLGDRRARRKHGARWAELAEDTSILPFAATLAGRNRLRIDLPMLLALVLSAAIAWWLLAGGHAALFGVDPLAATQY